MARTRHSRLIMGSALGLATIAVAIDHTRHRLPEPQVMEQQLDENAVIILDEGASDQAASPCSLEGGASPCGLGGETPCGLGGGSPCSL